jgi:transglutaminase-like putative cysteine protease
MIPKRSPREQLELLLQIAMATMTALGTLMLGMGERDLTLPVLAMIVSASSVLVTDVYGYLQLNARVANIAGSTAVVVFVWDLLQRFSGDTQLLAVANLLIYLQFILLYQRKTVTIYWLLALLSFLQTAVATVLNFELLFGVLLLVYFVCGLLALGLFFIYRESARYGAAESSGAIHLGSTITPLLSSVAPDDRVDNASDPLSWPFVRQMGTVSAAALTFAVVFFFVMPRLGQRNWRQPILVGQSMLGASEKIVLGELGHISESPAEVMKVEFLEVDTGRPYLLGEAPLFRGVCLTRYEQNAWHQFGAHDTDPSSLPRRSTASGLVRQSIHMAASENSVVYCVGPVLAASRGLAIELDADSWRIERLDPQLDAFQLDTSGFVDRRQSLFLPHEAREAPEAYREYEQLKRLSARAAQIVEHVDPGDPLARARELTSHLHNSGQYSYTLSPPTRPPDVDAIEDFLFEQPRGHCEYFASALALMLRSVGIPSRVVIGFNGGEWNPWGKFYLVRELHAHAWVEAYLPPDKLPTAVRQRDPAQWRYGGWVTLDPTPGAEGSSARLGTPAGQPSLKQTIEYARYLWASYVMGLNADKQLRAIYEPLYDFTLGAGRAIASVETWSRLADGIYDWSGLREWQRTRRVPWRLGLLVIFAALASTWAVWRWRRRRQRPMTTWWSRLKHARRQRVLVDFYLQFEELLARYQQTRPVQETQLEFALAVRDWLAARAETSAVASVPIDIAQAYYRVRYGNSPLDSAERNQVELSLAKLRAALAAHR